jgi:hypothetical protein
MRDKEFSRSIVLAEDLKAATTVFSKCREVLYYLNVTQSLSALREGLRVVALVRYPNSGKTYREVKQ